MGHNITQRIGLRLAWVVAFSTLGGKACAQSFPPATRDTWEKDGWSYSFEWRPVNSPRVAEDFAESFVKVLVEKDFEGWLQHVDPNFKLMEDRALRLCETTKARTNLRFSIRSSLKALTGQIASQAEDYRYIRLLKTKLGVGPIFRLTLPSGGVMYHLWYLLQNNEGQVKGVDVYFFNSGESLADSFRRGALLLDENKSKSFVDRLAARDRELLGHRSDLSRLIMAHKSRDEVKVMQAYNELPESLSSIKFCMVYRLMAAKKYSVDRFEKVLRDFRKVYAGDVAGDLVAMDYYSERKDVDELFKTVTRIQRVIHPDAHLFLVKAKACLDRGEPGLCRSLLNLAHQIEPQMQDIYWMRAACESADGAYDKTLRIFKYLIKKHEVFKFDFLEQSPHFKGFVDSPQHKEFRAFLDNERKLKTDFLSDDLE